MNHWLMLREYGHGTDWLVCDRVAQYQVFRQLCTEAGIKDSHVTLGNYDALLLVASNHGMGLEVIECTR